MYWRKFISILGAICLLLSAAVVLIAVWQMHTLEKERNQARTAPMRQRRWPKPGEAPAGTQDVEPEEPEPEKPQAPEPNSNHKGHEEAAATNV